MCTKGGFPTYGDEEVARLWPGATVEEELSVGENAVYRLQSPSGPAVVRLYRPGRRSRQQVEAEWAWAVALQPYLRTPLPLAGSDGRVVQQVGGLLAVAMTHVAGRPVSWDALDLLEHHGRLLGALLRAVPQVEAAHGPSWAGWCRPEAAPAGQLDDALEALRGVEWVMPHRARLEALVAECRRRVASVDLGPVTWVHNDLHGYNVLVDAQGPVLIDLDDSVRAPQLFEWATPRIHLRAKTDLEVTWPRFVDAAGEAPDDAGVRLATAIHAVATMGEFPAHLDMAQLSDPGAVLERYLGYAEAELEGR